MTVDLKSAAELAQTQLDDLLILAEIHIDDPLLVEEIRDHIREKKAALHVMRLRENGL